MTFEANRRHSVKTMSIRLWVYGIVGIMMFLPVLSSFSEPGDLFVDTELNAVASRYIVGLIVWTCTLIWFMRFRYVKRVQVVIPLLLFYAGLICSVFIIAASLGAGLMSIALACAIPYIVSLFHAPRVLNAEGIKINKR